jgi:hypothetical protein
MRNAVKYDEMCTYVESVMMIATAKTMFEISLAVVLPIEMACLDGKR